MCVRCIAEWGQWECVEATGGARLSPGTFPDPPHALLPTHISSQKGSLDFVWLIFYGHHCTIKNGDQKIIVSALLLGCGDLRIQDVSFLPDPCPLPDKTKKRSLVEREKTIYAPFSGVGGIVYDKDAVYVDLGGSHSHGASLKVLIQ